MGTISLLGVNPLGPLVRGEVIAGVTRSLGVANGAPVAGGAVIARDDPAIAYYGGFAGDYGPTYPRNLATTTYDVTGAGGARSGSGGRSAFRTDATGFDVRIYSVGSLADFSLLVDGRRVDLPALAVPADGSLRWVHVDLSQAGLAPGMMTMELEYRGGADVAGLALSPGAAIAPVDLAGPRIVFLGDSITEAGGAASPAEDWVSLVARSLGIADAWQSGLGGTGYEKALNGRPALVDRIQADGVAADGDVYVIAMGINDDPAGDITDGATAVFQALTAAHPHTRIVALTAWNPQAPRTPSLSAARDAQIAAAAAAFAQVSVVDVSTLHYTTFDGTHPDADGNRTIAGPVYHAIARAIGADGTIDQGVANDIVGPLFVAVPDPAHTAYTVAEDGVLTNRFHVVEDGGPTPILQLVYGAAIDTPGLKTVTVTAYQGGSPVARSDIAFTVRPTTIGSEAADFIDAGTVAHRLEGHGGADVLIGSPDEDLLIGGEGNDTLDGRAGADTMTGGIGDDAYTVDDGADLVTELAGEGTDTVVASIEGYVLPANVERLTLAGAALSASGNTLDNVVNGNAPANALYGQAGNDIVRGNAGDDTLYGNDGNDTLSGGVGADHMFGGAGDDSYEVDDAGDWVIEYAGQGTDTVRSTLPGYALPANVERLELYGGAVAGSGNDLANVIGGTALANTLDGGGRDDILRGLGGDDTLLGSAGNDTLYGGTGADRMIGGAGDDSYEVADAGDTIVELPGGGNDIAWAYVSGYVLPAEVERLSLYGGATSGTGNAGANILWGGGLADTLSGAGGNDTLHGAAGDDRLNGDADADLLDGGTGVDTMAGGAGDDTYLVDTRFDVVVEAEGEGFDTVMTTARYYTIAPGVERVVSLAIGTDLTGDDRANILIGNRYFSLLSGLGGNDVLRAGEADDSLSGGDGDDRLYGGTGADLMLGNAGNDSYEVTDAGDRVIEAPGEGIDTVWSYLPAYALPDNVERLELYGVAAVGTGNDLANAIGGNALANTLQGLAGNDILRGQAGNDVLLGGDDDDQLYGGAGADTLTGGAGADRFWFDGLETATNRDTIADFATGDRIVLARTAFAAFAGHAIGALAAGEFGIGAAATTPGQHLLYDPSTGVLRYDPDGVGGTAGIDVAVLAGAPTLAASEIIVF